MTAMNHAPQRASRAFTLIEIMVVVSLIALILTMSIYVIASATHRDPLTQAIKDVTDACRIARSQAILSGNTTALRLYPIERRIAVDAPQAPPPKQEDVDKGTVSTNTPAGFSAELSDRLQVRLLDVNFIDCSHWDTANVYFNANGTCDEFNMILVGEDGAARRIVLDVATAIPDVIPLR